MAGTNIGENLVGTGIGIVSYIGASKSEDLVAGGRQGGVLAGVTGFSLVGGMPGHSVTIYAYTGTDKQVHYSYA